MSGLRTGETIADGRVVAEEDVVREDEGDVPFQVREATTIYQGPRSRRGDKGIAEPGQTFQVREAVTTVMPPPHWAQLTEQEEPEHAHHPEQDANSREVGIS